ncbi:MAG TPA: MFS transporter [Alphaproteobacteria bacterium]|nr:MFS transporter [Alphaproteobacteria bacterium]
MIVPLIVACALFMENLDGTVITTALPAMAISFSTSPIQLSLGVTAYMLSLAVFVPVSGWVADRFGARTVFRLAISVFILGSILCGLSNGVLEFAAARVLQGIGGAMMVPVGRLVMIRSVEKSELVRAMAYLTVPALIGPVLGPPVGGFITTYVSWRWIFFLNVPIGLLGIGLVSAFIENYREAETWPFDWIGFFLIGTSLTCLMYDFDLVGHPGTNGVQMWILLAVGVVGGILALLHSKHRLHPLLDPTLLEIPTFAKTTAGGTIFRMSAGALPFLLPLLLQVGFGMSAFASGLLTFASALGSFTMKMSTRPILRRFGFRTVLIGNGIISAASIVVCSFFAVSTPTFLIFVLLLAGGFFRSLQYTSLNTLSFADILPAKLSGATSVSSMMQQLSNGMGIALGAVLLHGMLAWRGAASDALSAGDIRISFAIAGALSLFSLPFFRRLAPDAGAEISGHQAQAAAAARAPVSPRASGDTDAAVPVAPPGAKEPARAASLEPTRESGDVNDRRDGE